MSAFKIIFMLPFILAPIIIITTIIIIVNKARKGPTITDSQTNQIEKMATMLGKVAVDMAKEMNPEYKSLKCPNCGAALTDDVEVCEYCDAPLTKVVATKNK